MAKKITTKNIKKAIVKLAALPVPKADAEAKAWIDADDQAKKPQPVESDKPGVPSVHKPKKIAEPIIAPTGDVITYHFIKLMERLAAEQGGTSLKALDDLRADIAKRK